MRAAALLTLLLGCLTVLSACGSCSDKNDKTEDPSGSAPEGTASQGLGVSWDGGGRRRHIRRHFPDAGGAPPAESAAASGAPPAPPAPSGSGAHP